MLRRNMEPERIEDQTMDAVSSRRRRGHEYPEGCDHIALVLQGGGALGAYQAGVYQALHEAGLWPDSIAGVSIGGINGAIIAGNRPERRLERLRAFWETVTAGRGWPWLPEGDEARKTYNLWSSLMTIAFGQPGFFTPRPENAWLSPRGTRSAIAFYDTKPLRETLLRLIDFDVLNNGDVRYAAGSVNVATGNFVYFDSTRTTIEPEHVMASGALPPALPMIKIGSDYFWDGGLVSNTPLQQIVDDPIGDHVLVFQVDLFSALGAVPRDMPDVLGRQKDIQYSSRTRLVTDYFKRAHAKDLLLKRLLDRLPDDTLDAEEKSEKSRLAQMSSFTILQLIYQQAAYEGQAKDYEFSGASMRDHWDSGYQDTLRTLAHKDWLAEPDTDGGLETHDIHREEE
jgi:NTE family protein